MLCCFAHSFHHVYNPLPHTHHALPCPPARYVLWRCRTRVRREASQPAEMAGLVSNLVPCRLASTSASSVAGAAAAIVLLPTGPLLLLSSPPFLLSLSPPRRRSSWPCMYAASAKTRVLLKRHGYGIRLVRMQCCPPPYKPFKRRCCSVQPPGSFCAW